MNSTPAFFNTTVIAALTASETLTPASASARFTVGVTLFEDRGKANAANEKALAWIRGSLFDLIEGDPEIIAGEVLAEVLA
jgi:hypothetical protein